MLKQYSHNLLLSGFLLAFGAFANAQTSTTMSLSDCIQFAIENHPDVKTAQLQIKDADWRVKENLATGLPQISAGVSYQYFIQRPGIPASALGFPGAGEEKVAFSAVHSLSPSISLNQLVFNNSYLLSIRAARYYRQYVENQLALARQTVRNKVTDAYLPALLITDNLSILDKNISNLEKLFSDTKAINQAGFAEQLDVDRLELSLSTLRSERGNLARQREIVVNALKFTMGMPVGTEISIADNTTALLSAAGEVDLTSPADFMTRPEYMVLLKGRELNEVEIDLYRKPWMPTVAAFVQWQGGLQGGFGNKNSDNFDQWFYIPSSVAGVSVTIPIYDGGGTKAKRERAFISAQTVDIQKGMLENAISLELDSARKQYLNAKERVSNQEKNVALAQRIYDTTQTKYKSGVGSSFEITQAESGLYSAQQGLLQAQFDLLTAKVAIKKAMGQ